MCAAFNADFDGDQMAVHVPLSVEAQTEARVLMMATNNILSPSNGSPIIVPSQDMVLGIYYMSREKPGCKGEGMIFANVDEVSRAYQSKIIDMHAKIKVMMNVTEYIDDSLTQKNKIVETTTGRALISQILPKNIPYTYIDQDLNKKAISKLFDVSYRLAGLKETVLFADNIKNMGFKYSTLAGVSIGVMIWLFQKRKSRLQQKLKKKLKK